MCSRETSNVPSAEYVRPIASRFIGMPQDNVRSSDLRRRQMQAGTAQTPATEPVPEQRAPQRAWGAELGQGVPPALAGGAPPAPPGPAAPLPPPSAHPPPPGAPPVRQPAGAAGGTPQPP